MDLLTTHSTMTLKDKQSHKFYNCGMIMAIMIIFIFKREEGSLFDAKDAIRIRGCLNFTQEILKSESFFVSAREAEHLRAT